MQINKDVLKSLNPCTSRYWNFLKYNADFSGSFSEFLELDSVSYDDKVWVAVSVLNKSQLVNWTKLCAESVLHIFEKEQPKDKRVSNCIDYLKSIDDFNILTDIERDEIEKHIGTTTKNTYDTAYTNYATQETQKELNIQFLKQVINA